MVNSPFGRYLSQLSPDVSEQVGNFYNYENSNPYSNIRPNQYANVATKHNPGDQLYADLIRAQTQDYNQRFAPVENFMAGQITATGTKSLAGDLDRTRANMGSAVKNVQGQQNRDMARMGLQGNNNIANSTTAVGARVGGLNDTRMRDGDRRQSLLSGSMSGISQKARRSNV